ncbi:FAD/NAD(P)-binding protein [Saxibacter everestensis]|uniref:FAD/NAD(P)-binding protein n=1 Tax=Saxibacter everestensis TaxID=2909229 RepID=A0ABY8QSQ4_9MICO|nr:FAD/NAD(P)-binding protein [Brevibacteriaceae bacterium ZFBP1038]
MQNDIAVAIIGAGPRGTTVFERLVAYSRQFPKRSVTIHILDPHLPGAGQVWRTDQSRSLLMNTQPHDQTVFPDSSVNVELRETGLSMGEWVKEVAAGRIAVDPESQTEVLSLHATSFPSRALYGAYLSWAFRHLRETAPENMTVRVHHTRVTQLRELLDVQHLTLDNGRSLDVDAVVLALGHLPAHLTPLQEHWDSFAREHGLSYQPPSLPADIDWRTVLPAGEPVIFRGFALNFFDIMALSTIDRGGKFVRDDPAGQLRYEPSGDEPILIPGSRRGVPYRAKPIVDNVARPEYQHRYITEPALARLRSASNSGRLFFDKDVWPLILRDALRAYYLTLQRVAPGVFAHDPARIFDFLDSDSAGNLWDDLIADVVPERAHRFELGRLLHPLDGRKFSSAAELDDWMLGYLDEDVAEARRGADSPGKMAALAIYTARDLVKALIVNDGLEEYSFLTDVRGWFEDFAQSVGSGPPLRRIEEVAALARAGIIRFIGPDMHVDTVVEDEGGEAFFVASSPQVANSAIRSRVLAEAIAPANRALAAADSLLADLLTTGAARVRVTHLPEGIEHEGTGLDVTARPYRLIDASGQAHKHRYVIGLQLSSVQWGTAIAAQPGSNAVTLQDADALARDILGLDR